MTLRHHIISAILPVLLIALRLDAASVTGSPVSRPSPDNSLGAEILEERRAIERQVRADERREMVRPAPKGFKPESAQRKVRLTLVARDKAIRLRDSFWYRLELQNVGHESVLIQDYSSFFKSGMGHHLNRIKFTATLPDGSSTPMYLGILADELIMRTRPDVPIDIPNGEHMTKEELHVFMRRDAARRQADKDICLTLAPGETLITRPWRWLTNSQLRRRIAVGSKDLGSRPPGAFRELWTEFDFNKPGLYKIQAEYIDEPPQADSEDFLRRMELKGVRRKTLLKYHAEEVRNALGHVRSNIVSIEVLP